MSTYPRFYWIAGGRAKAGGIDSLAEFFPRVAKAYLVGEAAEDFAKVLHDKAPTTISGTIAAATAQAFADAKAAGEDAVILLSPACASFDQFPDFEVRGDAFRAAVRDLAQSKDSSTKATPAKEMRG
jgi:UDP-N-acetylmuramoylalanine--D-glutamate ligase